MKNTIFKNRGGGVDNQHHGPIKATQPSKNFMQTISNDDDNSVLGDQQQQSVTPTITKTRKPPLIK